MRRPALRVVLALAMLAPPPAAAQEVQRERVQIEHGPSATTIPDTITGRGGPEYLFGLRGGLRPHVQRDGDLTLIRLQHAHYEVPDAFILGA